MNKKGYTTESGGRQNGFAIEPEINPISEGESKKSILLFIGILLPFLIGGFYYIRTVLPWIKSVGGVIVKRDLIQESTSNEWDGGQLGLVIEFESKFAAKKAFYSEVFQKYLQSRDLMELVTISTL